MGAIWIWGIAAVAYGAFSLWYNGWRGPLTAEEVEGFMKRFEATSIDRDPERLEAARAFLESDDGKPFFMLNLIRLYPDPVIDPGRGDPRPAQKVLEEYTGYFMPALLRRAGHPTFVGRAAGRYLEHWGVEPDPGWTMAGVIRYRSRRDMVELATDPRFGPKHAYKIAAMANTLAFPVAPAVMFVGPRVWVLLLLALIASLTQLLRR
jgi:hypothetical protein